MGATDRFVTLVQGPEEGIDLDEGCLLVAAHARPGADAGEVVDAGRARLDALAETCSGPSLTDLRRHLFETVGFSGNRRRYDDPRNSLLDEVLERRTGIPITLAVVVIEVGRRLGLRFDGIGLPGHFLVGVGPDLYLDAFEEGRLLDSAACRRRFAELAGADAPWSAGLLAPVGPRARPGAGAGQPAPTWWRCSPGAGTSTASNGCCACGSPSPVSPVQERVERATVLSALGRYDEAAIELDRLAERMEALDPGRPSRHPSAATDPSADAAELRARAAPALQSPELN